MIEKYIDPPSSLPKFKQLSQAGTARKHKRLLRIGIIFNAAIGGVTFFLLQSLPATYISKGAAIIPAVGTQGSVELSETGKTSDGSGQTPYGYLVKVDPRENYQYIAGSEAVLAKAAATLNMSSEEFGEPSIMLDQGTTIIEFELSGKTAEEAQQKAWVFYQAWVERISDLRSEEAMRQDINIEQDLEAANRQLQTSQEKISEFRGQSALKVANQVNQLAEQVENLRIQRANLLGKQQGADARFRQLSRQLNFTPEQAGDALILLDDTSFQSSLQNYSDAIAKLEIVSSRWLPDSPQVRIEADKKETAQKGMIERSRRLLGKPVDLQFIAQLNLEGGGRRALVEELVNLQVQREELAAQVQTLEQQIEQLDSRLKILTQEQFTLNRLERDAQISESIFAESLARLDINKPDYATYYPPLQLITEPLLPLEEEKSKSRTIILGALAFSLLSTTGLLMIWWGQSQQEHLFKYSSSSKQEKQF